MSQIMFKWGLSILAINVITLYGVVTFTKSNVCVQQTVVTPSVPSRSAVLIPNHQPTATAVTYRF